MTSMFRCGLFVFLVCVPAAAAPAGAAPQEGSSGPAALEPVAEGASEPESAPAPPPPAGGEQEVDIEELERRIDLLAEEVERLRSGEAEVDLTDDQTRARGLAPSAAAAYRGGTGVSIAGYGEMLYENYASSGTPRTSRTSQFDYLRAILYAGYRFNDKFLFNSELEVEHAREIYVEFAYVDYLATESFGLRAGMLLIPMGLVNEFHEPTVFMGAERPVTEQSIIPSSWRENGGGVYYAGDTVAVRAFVVNGLDGAGFSSSGVRGGRQKGARAKATDMAFTGRVDITPTPGVFFGASFYTGGSGQGEIVVDEIPYGIRTSIFDVHAQAQVRGFDIRGLFAQANLADTARLNQFLGLTGSGGVGETMRGGYVQFGYDVLSQVDAAGVGLSPYVRYEKVDTHAAVAAGFTRNPSQNNAYTTFGVELKPIPNIVVKVDHMWVNNAVDSGVNQFNVNVGYAF